MADHRILFLHLLTKICVLIQLIPIGQNLGVSYKGMYSPGRLILASIERDPGFLEKIQSPMQLGPTRGIFASMAILTISSWSFSPSFRQGKAGSKESRASSAEAPPLPMKE